MFKMIHWLVLLSFTFSCATQNPEKSASKPIELDLEVIKHELPNGMRVLLVPRSKLPVFSLNIFYKVGGKNEKKGITGASHFLEHLMFKGAKKYGMGQFDYIIEGNGGATNAYTTSDSTVYYENLPKDTLELILDVEADRMENLLIEPKGFEKERQVVLEERKMRYENSPRGQAYLTLTENAFKGTPYGTSVIGDIPDIKSVTRDQIHAYFKRFYAPNNAVMVLAGDFDPNTAWKIIKEKFGAIPASEAISKEHSSLTPAMFATRPNKPIVKLLKGNSPAPLFMMGWRVPPMGDPEAYRLDVLGSILGDGDSSYFQQKFVFSNKPKLTNIYAGNYSLEKAGIFFFGGELNKKEKPAQFEKTLKTHLKKACDEAITERALRRVKNQYLIGFYGELDTNHGLAQFLGQREAMMGDWKAYVKELAVYEAMTVDEVKKSCHQLASDNNTVFVSVWEKF